MFGFHMYSEEFLFLDILGIEDIPTVLDICSLGPAPFYERMRTYPHILKAHTNKLGADLDGRFVLF
jgi:hypothetical protein